MIIATRRASRTASVAISPSAGGRAAGGSKGAVAYLLDRGLYERLGDSVLTRRVL